MLKDVGSHFFLPMTLTTAFFISETPIPKCSISSFGFPDSPNRFCTPINSIGTGHVLAKSSATADPIPPAT